MPKSLSILPLFAALAFLPGVLTFRTASGECLSVSPKGEVATHFQLDNQWGDCVPKLECFDVGESQDIIVKRCECRLNQEKNGCLSDEDSCRDEKVSCRNYGVRFGKECPTTPEVEVYKGCQFAEASKDFAASCRPIKGAVVHNLSCEIREGQGSEGVRVNSGCVPIRLVKDDSKACIGLSPATRFKPDPTDSTRCIEDEGKQRNEPYLCKRS